MKKQQPCHEHIGFDQTGRPMFNDQSGDPCLSVKDNNQNHCGKIKFILKATQKLTKVGGWEFDVEKQTMFWTDEVYKIHGFQNSNFAPGSMQHIESSIRCYEIEDRTVIREAFKNCYEKGQSYAFDFPLTKATGDTIWIHTKAEPIFKRDKVVSVVGNIMDITERKQEEIERENLIQDLKNTLNNVKTLSNFLPICSYCKKIRDNNGHWKQIESYIRDHLNVNFSHTICQECARIHYSDYDLYDE